MPITDPAAQAMQGPPTMGTEAPQGAGMMASPGAGLPPQQPGSPQAMMQLGQIAAKLLDQQKKTKYAIDLSKHIKQIMQKVQGAQLYQDNPQADSDIATIIAKLGSLAEKLGKSGPSQSPALTTSLADMVGRAGNSGATQ